MEALYKISKDLTIKVEADNLPELIQKMTIIRESIGSEKCGKCESDDTFPRHRVSPSKDDYYELVCGDCWAKLELGQNKSGKTIYKKRASSTKDENGNRTKLPNRGWTKWNPETKKNE